MTLLPNFIVIGAAKCGTTSICELLGMHPDVFMSDPKEPCYFSHMDQETRTLEWYESLFSDVSGETAVGEGSTAYTHPDVIHVTAERIRSAIPDCRLIYMVRNPLRRLESDWKMRRHEDWTPESISAAAIEQPSLVRHGLYWENLSVYREYFPDEQILIIFLEDFVTSPDTELCRCHTHIGVDPSVQPSDADQARNRSADFRKDGRIAAGLRRWSAFERAKSLLPAWFIDRAKEILTQRNQFHVEWQDDVRRNLADRFTEDSALFLRHCGKPADFWNFES